MHSKLASRARRLLLSSCAWVALALGGTAARAHELLEFETDVKPILQTSCGGKGCHVNEKTSGVELTSYESLMASVGDQYGTRIVAPGEPDDSPLLEKVSTVKPTFGERMPLLGDAMGDAQVAILRRWIQEGAQKSHHLTHGDFDGNDFLDISDVVATLLHLFLGGPPPRCSALADSDGDGKVDLTDAVLVLNHLFLAGPGPAELTETESEACEQSSELSFASLYQKVFAPSCAFSSCHSATIHRAGLNLSTREDAHRSLVGVAPTNEEALANGLLRVDPGKPERSFLLRKLTLPGPGEGNRMPPTSSVGLSQTAIAAFHEWILAGAPLEGTIHGVPDLTEVFTPPIDKLPAPPLPQNGIQLHLPPFAIGAGREREIFYFMEKPFAALAADPVIQRIDIHMTDDSHHFIIYQWIGAGKPPPGVREDNLTVDLLGTHRFVLGAQQAFFSLAFPAGVGMKMSRDASFDMNSHYLNLNGEQTLYGEVYINIFFAEPGSITTFVKPIFDINPFINVPPNKTSTTKWSFPGLTSSQADPAIGSGGKVSRETHIYALSTHMHRHGTRFSVFLIKNGVDVVPRQMVHDNLDWDDPKFQTFDPPLVLTPGQGLRFETTHAYLDPPTASAPALTFGPTSEDEMAILLGYYAVK